MGLNLRGIQWPVHESQLQAIISALQSNEVAHLGIKADGLDKKAFILKRSVFMADEAICRLIDRQSEA